jgi:hypothetical protein
MSPQLPLFVVDVSNELGAAEVESAGGRGVVVAPEILIGDLYNARDLCDSLA